MRSPRTTDAATLAWQGQTPLWKVFWLYNFLGSVIIGLILNVLIPSHGARWFIGVLVGVPFYGWSLVSLWRCAYNTKWVGWGHIARFLVLASLPSFFAVFMGEPVV